MNFVNTKYLAVLSKINKCEQNKDSGLQHMWNLNKRGILNSSVLTIFIWKCCLKYYNSETKVSSFNIWDFWYVWILKRKNIFVIFSDVSTETKLDFISKLAKIPKLGSFSSISTIIILLLLVCLKYAIGNSRHYFLKGK